MTLSVSWSIICRDLRLGLLRGSGAVTSVFFFLMVIALFPLGFGGDSRLLAEAAPAIIWVAVLLSALLSIETVYHHDYDDGTFDVLIIEGAGSTAIVFSKMISHWIMSGLLLLPVTMAAALMLALPATVLPLLLLSITLGTLYVSLLGGFGAVLTFGTRRPGLLLTFITLPLFVPMLILGLSALEAVLSGVSYKPYILLQASLLVATLPIALGASAYFLKASLRA